MGGVNVGALNAKIGANISEFRSAMVDAANTTRDLGNASTMTQGQLQDLVAQLEAERTKLRELVEAANDSRSAHHDAGEAMNFTAGEAVALGAGIGLAVEAFNAALHVLPELIDHFVAFGHELELLHERVNVPLEVAAAWKQTESVTGISAEKIAASIAMMDTRLETGNKQAVQAVHDLGLSIEELKEAAPDQQVALLSEAFSHLEDNGYKADVVIRELMGRGGLGMLPALTPEAAKLRDEIERINGPLSEQVKIAKEYKEQTALLSAEWDKIKRTLEAPLVGGLADLLKSINQRGLGATLGGLTPGGGMGLNLGVGQFRGMEGPVGGITGTDVGLGDVVGHVNLAAEEAARKAAKAAAKKEAEEEARDVAMSNRFWKAEQKRDDAEHMKAFREGNKEMHREAIEAGADEERQAKANWQSRKDDLEDYQQRWQNFFDILKQWDAFERASAAERKRELEETARDLGHIGDIIGTVGSMMGTLGIGGKAGQTVAAGLGGAFSGASGVFSGLASGDILGAVESGLQGVGSLVTMFKSLFSKPEYEKVMGEIGAKWGVDISEGLAKAIESTEAKDHVSRAMAELLNLESIMKESGKDPGAFTAQIGDLLNAVALHAVPAKEGIAELGKAFEDLRASAEAGSVSAEEAMVTMIQRSRELGESIPEIAKFVLDSLENVAKSLPTLFAGTGGEATSANATILGASFGALAAQEGVVKAAEDLKAAFEQLTKDMPAGAALPKGLEHMAMIEELLGDESFKKGAEASQAGAEAMKGLEQTGYLNQETTDAFQQDAIALQHQAVQAAIDHGYSPEQARIAGEEANLPLLAQLQKAQSEGAVLSPEAQQMLADAQKDGVLPLKDVATQQLGVLKDIRGLLGGRSHEGNPADTSGDEGSATTGHHGRGENLRSFQSGGTVPATGPYRLHAGETVIPSGSRTVVVHNEVGGKAVNDLIIDVVTGEVYSNGQLVSYLKRAVTGAP